MQPEPMTLHPLAEQLNATLARECPTALALLSERGKRFFFPSKGILAQGAEAKAKATRYNATIGIATDDKGPMHLACVHESFAAGSNPRDLYDYAPSFGKPELRAAWQQKQREETPSLAGAATSLPVVTNALTHGLSVIGDLFLDPGDEVLISDHHWENYDLCYATRLGAKLSQFPLFDRNLTGFNQNAFMQALAERRGKKLLVALNFPNNPTGYTPTRGEAGAIAEALKAAAAAGTRIVAVFDDAYYGMFFDDACERESVFGRCAAAHENLLAIKVDGATKEEFVWGLRVGFLTYACKGATPAALAALEQKTAGFIRATVSNISQASQSIVLKALKHPQFRAQQREKVEILRRRAAVTARECRKPEYAALWDVYPFNSGYFMCLRLKSVDADKLRLHLLDQHGLGTIALGRTDLRVAFSCLDESQIADVFARIAAGAKALTASA